MGSFRYLASVIQLQRNMFYLDDAYRLLNIDDNNFMLRYLCDIWNSVRNNCQGVESYYFV